MTTEPMKGEEMKALLTDLQAYFLYGPPSLGYKKAEERLNKFLSLSQVEEVERVREENDKLRKAVVRADKLQHAVRDFLDNVEPLTPSEHKLRRSLDAFDRSLLSPQDGTKESAP